MSPGRELLLWQQLTAMVRSGRVDLARLRRAEEAWGLTPSEESTKDHADARQDNEDWWRADE
jgi:hypothetical protein